ncbi:MAG: homoserine kinase [Betaproteobacteria bacterium]|nr:homoserine kinase [Betaproteobacteria bacterium]
MSVFTPVHETELAAWLTRYAVGGVSMLEPIPVGVENSNFFLTTDSGRYVLTLYERMPAEDLPFYLNLMAHLAGRDVPCPAPLADRSGAYFSLLNGKPASLVTRLEGAALAQPSLADCAEMGAGLARLHLAGASYRSRQENRRGAAWRRSAARAVKPFLEPEQKELLEAEMSYQQVAPSGKLPKGAIHGDLFRDNALFSAGRLTGIIDFGFAATDLLAYDLAITVNDWCLAPGGGLDSARSAALLRAYHANRPLQAAETEAWPRLLRTAALRFWLSRLYDRHLPRVGDLVDKRDPAHFERLLRTHVELPTPCPLS